MKPSELAWKRIEKIFNAIVIHGFNQGLIHGLLEEKKFTYFIEQDCIFLKALGESFSKNINNLKLFFDDMGDKTNSELKSQMIEEFYLISSFEWHFWNDTYQLKEFDSTYDTF
jgi:thiaminase/transcriptional activator TenA